MTRTSRSELPAELAGFVDSCIGSDWEVEALHGDASVRRYFRVASGDRRLILAYYPEAVRESLQRFVAAHRALSSTTRVPAILSHSDSGILQDDVGDRTLFDLLHEDPAAAVSAYREAIDLLIDFQRAVPEGSAINPPFDRAKFADELAMTAEFYVEQLSGRKAESRLFDLFDRLAGELVSHPYLLCHRDYHGQNIHISNGSLFVIDFQDLRMGPDTYDVASLLRDRGVGARLPAGAEDELLAHYDSRGDFAPGLRSRYFANLLQRSIKAIGTFAKQAVTRDRRNYLAFIPPTLDAVRHALDEKPEYGELRTLFPMQFRAE